MKAVVTTGNGGFDKLSYQDVPVPRPGPGEALLRVLAAGVNNTEINTREDNQFQPCCSDDNVSRQNLTICELQPIFNKPVNMFSDHFR